jgi:hypothetical protein
MKTYILFLFILINAASVSAQTMLRGDDLKKDFTVLRQAFETLHPGLYQYVTKDDMDRHFETCRRALSNDQSLAEAFLAITKLTASIRCGHSQTNFWNQDTTIQHELFDTKTSLPLYFKIIGQRMLVTHSVDNAVLAGTELRKINGVAVSDILTKLRPYVRGDGSSNGKRDALLAITGQKYEYFDVFYPLLFPLSEPVFNLEVYDLKTRKTRQVTVFPLSRQQRANLMKQNDFGLVQPLAELAWLGNQTALLRINSMFDWNTDFNLKMFIEKAFTEINQKKARHLILDIRRLEGGNDQYGKQIVEQIIRKPIAVIPVQTTWAYTSIDSSFNRYITNGSWADGWKYRPATDFMRTARGQYRNKNADKPIVFQPTERPFRGKVWLLTSPVNSSAGFLLAQWIKDHKLATVVGQTTGGNRKGITAGALFFVRLPNSGIEVDVPLIGTGYDVSAGLPDAGVTPDLFIQPSVEDQVRGIDTELDAVKKLIQRRGQLY